MASATLLSPLLLLLLLLARPPLSSSNKCNKDDKKALYAIRSFWGNPPFAMAWDQTLGGCCGWGGVSCDSSNRVNTFVIQYVSNLTGTIPPAIGDLPFLTTLIIRKQPNITGSIVPAIARLTRLTDLWLDWNSLSGPVPSFLFSHPSLSSINLAFNKLSGSIPPGIFPLSKISYLRLDRNQLTGPIPDSFGSFLSGTYLILSHNNLSGPVPKSMGAIDFSTLDLSRNMLSGDASFLFHPSNTTSWYLPDIDISRNTFEFDLSSVEFTWQMDSLDISHNRIYGSIPQQIAKLQRLQHLNVTYNRLCGKIPAGMRFDESSYAHNRCLCGAPLPPCK